MALSESQFSVAPSFQMTPSPIQAIHHVAILIRELPRSEHFYGEVLALPLLKRWLKPETKEERSLWYDLGQGSFLAVELCPETTPVTERESQELGWHLLALRIPRNDREVWRERLRQAGYPCTEESPYTLYCRDPDGNRIGLSHWPEPATD